MGNVMGTSEAIEMVKGVTPHLHGQGCISVRENCKGGIVGKLCHI